MSNKRKVFAGGLALALGIALWGCGEKAAQPSPTEKREAPVHQEEMAPPAASETGETWFLEGVSGDDWFTPPTNEGLADTTWFCEKWILELRRGEESGDYFGTAVLNRQDEPEADFRIAYTGQWRMEEFELRLVITRSDGECLDAAFPVEISPSGELLHIRQSRDGIQPPFFEEDMVSMELELSYG